MRNLLLFMFISLSTISVFSQNLDFENWVQDTVLLLDDFNTTTSDYPAYGSLSVIKSTDHIDGNFSILLQTVLTPNNDTLFGDFLNGNPDNFSGGQPTSLTNVDSVIGYYKYDIQPGDTALFLCMAKYNGSLSGGNVFPITGTQSTWTRFSYLISSTSTDSVIIAAASSNAINNIGITPGSYIMFDNIQLKSNSLGTDTIPNYSFERWSNFVWEDLAGGWMTSNQWVPLSDTLPVSKTTDAFSGTYACEITTIFDTLYNDTIQGYISLGEWTQNGPIGGFPYTYQPDSIRWHFKSNLVSNDTAWISVMFKNGGTTIASNGEGVYSNNTVYQTTSQVVNLPIAPDTVFIAISGGRNPGSWFIIDNIEFNFPVGIHESYNISQVVSFPNPVTGRLYFSMNFSTERNTTIKIYSMDGRLMSIKKINNLIGHHEVSVNTSNLSKGNYIYKVIVGNEVYTKTFIKE